MRHKSSAVYSGSYVNDPVPPKLLTSYVLVWPQVNQMLDIPFKTYVRMVSCFPEKATRFDFDNSMRGLDNSEKVNT